MVLVLWDFLAIIPLSLSLQISLSLTASFFVYNRFPVYFFSFCCPFTI